MADLLGRIQRSSRGKGKGFAWNVELDLPGVAGTTDAGLLATVACNEIIDYIRSMWDHGRKVDGSTYAKTRNITDRRKLNRQAIIGGDSYEELQTFAVEKIGRGKNFPKWFPKRVNFDRWSEGVKKNYIARMPTGKLNGTKPRMKRRQLAPVPENPIIYSSGIMTESLRGKLRNARFTRSMMTKFGIATVRRYGTVDLARQAVSAAGGDWDKMGLKNERIEQHCDIRLPRNRQFAGGWYGGLNQQSVNRETRTYQHMRMTRALAEGSMSWAQFGKVAQHTFFALRVARLFVRVLM